MIKVLCKSETREGSRTLAEFEDDSQVSVLYSSAQRRAMDWLEDVLHAIASVSLMSILNDIQAGCNYGKKVDEPKIFPNKYDMPLCIINLVLDKYRIWLEEDCHE